MDGLKKRILLDLFVTPMTVIPAAIGGSLMLLSLVRGGMLAFGGFVCLLIGFGAVLTNFVFNLSAISRKAAREWQQEQKEKRARELDFLDKKLRRTSETSDEAALRNLRALYDSFCEDVAGKKLPDHIPNGIFQQIDDLFESCISQLSRSYEIWEQSQKMTGNLQKEMFKQRKKMIKEVETSVKALADVLNEVRVLRLKSKRGELTRLQKTLAQQLDVAKATEGRISSLDLEIEERFAEYQ